MSGREELRALLVARGVAGDLAVRLAEYGAILMETNRRFNLTAADSAEQLARHVLDSLTLQPYVRGPLVDIGSGGGLPAIPLALAADVEVTLIEATGKKAAFLDDALQRMGLRGRVERRRAEDAARDPALRERFSTATARAVALAPAVAELTVPFLALGGLALLQRGRFEPRERNATADAASMLGAVLEAEVELDGERRILLVRKEHITPQRFPRAAGMPAKRPLCY